MTESKDKSTEDDFVSFAVPSKLVKHVKMALEKRNRANAAVNIRAITKSDEHLSAYDGKFLVPTNFMFNHSEDDTVTETARFVYREALSGHVDIIDNVTSTADKPTRSLPMQNAVTDWYSEVRGKDPSLFRIDLKSSIENMPSTYTIYGPLLLLAQHPFQSPMWQELFEVMDPSSSVALFRSISKRLKVPRIAENAPIPLHDSDRSLDCEETQLNIARTPTNIIPLFGDFGPICETAKPAPGDFSAAFWTNTKQNGITQVWAPRYTMFSRGNVVEKARLLRMSSVATAVSQGCSAVDLYAGIGYFAFSYVAAGVKKVLCWDSNPWSIEGLRRGAVANKWGVQVLSDECIPGEGEGVIVDDSTRLVAFVESNEMALARIENMREMLPPVRHVNCGLLPTSKSSHAAAAATLDPALGGWVHVHESFAVAEVKGRAEEVRQNFVGLIRDLDVKRGFRREAGRKVVPEFVQRVKSYAPGVFHCVVHIFISPIT